MSSAPPVKRHRIKRAGEKRRDAADEDRSNEASEEDNRDDMSDVGSLLSVNASNSAASTTTSSPRMGPPAGLPPFGGSSAPPNSASAASGQGPNGPRKLGQRVGELSVGEVSDRGLDSPTYDGDVESSSTIGGTPVHSQFHHHSHSSHHQRRPSSPTPGGESGESSNSLSLNTGASANNGPATARGEPSSSATPFGRAPTPKASRASLKDDYAHGQPKSAADCLIPSDVPVQPSEALRNPMRDTPKTAERVPPKMYERPAERSVDDIRGFVQRAIDGRGDEDGISRWWKTRPPPEDRPVRIYADGVYDLFHFGHALQLRQAKLSFPRVHLLVGVCSDQLCAESKSRPAMTHAERIEALRHCRWADEIIPDAPWVVDKAFVEKYNIDYLAHDEEVYPSKDHEDVYAFAKESGIFLPTRRTPAISTSDLLERIVRGYRDGFFDSKLEKNGHPELLAADVDWDSSASVERRERRKKKALEKHSQVQQLGEALGQALESGKALQLEVSPPGGKKLQLQVSPP